jgi:hypothetical protein
MFDLAGNRFAGNAVADIHEAENVRGLVNRGEQPADAQPPRAVLTGPSVVKVDQEMVFDAAESRDSTGRELAYRWRLQPDVTGAEAQLRHAFTNPGFYRLALTVNNGALSDLAWRDLYVVDQLDELGTEAAIKPWDAIDPHSTVRFAADGETRLVGAAAMRATVDPYSGWRVTLRYSAPSGAAISLADKSHLVVWLKTRNENIPSWQDVNPLITVVGRDGRSMQLVPAQDFLGTPTYNEAREGWTYFAVPLAGDDFWKREGDRLTEAAELHFGFDSWGAPPLVIWIDGLGLK